MIRTILTLVLLATVSLAIAGCGGGVDAPDAPGKENIRQPKENPRRPPGPSAGLSQEKDDSGGGEESDDSDDN